MFDFVRSHTRLFQGLLVLLIFPSFVFFGVQGYSRFSDDAAAKVAEVDGRSITRQELDAAHQRSVERIRQQMPGVDAKMFDTPEMRRETLDGMVRERTMLSAADKLHLLPGDERLLEVFRREPRYVQLRNPDGSVNREELLKRGMSSELFALQLRQELGMQQVLQGVAGSVVAASGVVNAGLDAFMQRREVQLQRFDTKDFLAKANPSDAELEAYYKANSAQFKSKEQADIEYVLLDIETLKKGIAVSDDDARKYYTENAARYTSAEERRASHILIKADKDAAAPDKAKAKARAEALLADLRKAPVSFADVARANSQDEGSAGSGGDLDFFGRGLMDKAFEDAAFAMKQGEISNLVQTEFGYHIIQLAAVRGGEKKPFEAVRGEIEAEIRNQVARKRYVDAAEQFSNLVYEQSDSLQPVVDKLKLDKRTATVARAPAVGASGALASVKLLELVFGDDAVRKKRNTEGVEVGPNQMVSARVVAHRPETTLPFEQVKAQVRERAVREQAAAAARKAGVERLAQLKSATDAPELPSKLTLSRMKAEGQPRQVLDAVLGASDAKLPLLLGVDLADEGYAVVRLQKVLPREPLPEGDAALKGQYAQAWGNAETQAYLAALKTRFKAEIKPGTLGAAASAPAR